MLDLRDSENSNWIKNVGQQDEGEGIEKSSTGAPSLVFNPSTFPQSSKTLMEDCRD